MRKLILYIPLFFTGIISAQEVNSSSGGNATGNGGTASYTVGQVTYTSSSGTNGSVSAGVQQAYTITTTTGVNETNFNLEASVYPNPTTDLLVLSVNELKEDFKYQVLDMAGKLMTNGKIANTKTQLDFSSFAAGTYVIKISTNQNEIKTFQVVKNK